MLGRGAIILTSKLALHQDQNENWWLANWLASLVSVLNVHCKIFGKISHNERCRPHQEARKDEDEGGAACCSSVVAAVTAACRLL